MLSTGTFRMFTLGRREPRKRIKRNKDNFKGKIVIVDGVYSMDGDIALPGK
jgi:hypothetical protein